MATERSHYIRERGVRADITIKEEAREIRGTRGLLRTAKTRPVWVVEIKLHLTEEERAIASQRLLWDTSFFLAPYPKEHFDNMTPEEITLIGHIKDMTSTLQQFVNGDLQKGGVVIPDRVTFYSPKAAKDFEQDFVGRLLPAIKQIIEENKDPNLGTRSYEA